jgi:methyl-accepting chemotaxis protein
MPRKRLSPLPLLLPAIVLVPLCGVLAYLYVSSWHAADAQAAVSLRLHDSALLIGRELEAAVARQKAATQLISQSPGLHLWMKFEGARPTPSNRAHSEAALREAVNYSRLLPGVTLLMAAEKTRIVYKNGAPLHALSRNTPEDSWYFSSLKAGDTVVTWDLRAIRASTRVMEGRRTLGAVSCTSDVSGLAAGVLVPGFSREGLTVALANSDGEVVGAGGAETSGVRTIFDEYPAEEHDAVAAVLSALFRSDQVSYFTSTAGTRAVRTAAVRTPVPGWYLFISADFPDRLPLSRIVRLAGVTAATLVLLLLALLMTGLGRSRSTRALLSGYTRGRQSARTALAEIGDSAGDAQSAAAKLQSLGGQLAREAAAAVQAGAEADALLSRAEAREGEIRDGATARGSLLAQLAAVVHEAVDRSLALRGAAETISASAARAEEGLTRVITTWASASHAVDKAAKGIGAIAESARRLRLLSLNAALEAARAGATGHGLSSITEEIRALAEDANARVQAIAASLAEAGGSSAGAAAATQEAGRSVHEGAAASAEAARAIGGAWDGAMPLLHQVDGANTGAARVGEDASLTDRGRSAVQGLSRIVARIGVLAAEMAELAGRAAAGTTRAAHAAAAWAGSEKNGPELF